MVTQHKISVTGLGYVGLTLAAAFAQTGKVIGLDKSKKRIAELKEGFDRNGELTRDQLNHGKIQYTDDPHELKNADFHIIAVPTPIDHTGRPDLSILLSASETVGRELKKGDIVVYESSVYPGVTEDLCIPILERESHLICGKDFGVGYSPERISPADKEHQFSTIPKIVAGVNPSTLKEVSDVYNTVIAAGVFPVTTIKVAEASKIVENTQRDINISFMNEIALILHSCGMDSKEVLTAAQTKWNFLPFKPGLVGGHCIGVNTSYLAHKAEEVGYYPEVILAGRRVNEHIPKFLVESMLKQLVHLGIPIKGAKVAVLGLTYKENYSDIHDSKVLELIKELKEYEMEVIVNDPIADPNVAQKEFGLTLTPLEKIKNVNVIMLMVSHREYVSLDAKSLKAMIKKPGLIMDIKGIVDEKTLKKDKNITLWSL